MTSRTTAERIEFLRQGSFVERMHCGRKIGSYPSAQHVNNMMSLLLILHPNPDIYLVRLIQFHDAGELGAGDTPSPAKPFSGLGDSVNRVEHMVRENFGLNLEWVPTEDNAWLKSLDILEFYMFAQDQMAMGNSYLREGLEKAEAIMNIMIADGLMPAQVREYYESIRGGRVRLTDEMIFGEPRTINAANDDGSIPF